MLQTETFESSIGQKALAAISGLILFGFVVGHLLGNLQIFIGPNQINAYADKLRHLGVLLWAVRLFLLAALILHIVITIKLARENRKARPVRYTYEDTVEATAASRTMMISGMGLFAFIVYHLMHFSFFITHPGYAYLKDSLGRHDVYSMMVLGFQGRLVSAVYVVAIAALSFHLSHGASSWAQSLGWSDERWIGFWKRFGNVAAILIFAGYVSIPMAVLMNFLRLS